MANPLRNRLNQHANKSGRAYIEARVTDLNAIYSNARESLERSLISFVTSGKKSFTGRHLVALTEEIQQVFPKLEEAYREKAGQSIHYLVQSYYRSALNDLSMDDVPLGGFNKAQMQLAMDDMYTHIAGATRNMDEMAVKALRRISAQVIRESALTGETQAQVSKRLFLANGGTNFIFTDAKGATWNGEAYFDMLSRTTLNNSSRESYLQACADQGSDIVSVSFSGKPCPACAKWEGRLLSISGKTKGLPSLADAIASGLFHPNCTHHLVAVPPEIAEEYYTPEGRPKTGLNSPGNEERDDKDAWREYRKQQRGKTKKAKAAEPGGRDIVAGDSMTAGPDLSSRGIADDITKKYIADGHVDNPVLIDSLPIEVQREIELGAKRMYDEFGFKPISIVARPEKKNLSGDDFGHAFFDGIFLNSNYYANIEKFQREIKRSVADGFHPTGTDWRAVYYHESTHAMMNQYIKRMFGDLKQREVEKMASNLQRGVLRKLKMNRFDIKDNLSGYAAKSPGEFVAEAVGEYMNSADPRPIAREVAKELKMLLRRNKNK